MPDWWTQALPGGTDFPTPYTVARLGWVAVLGMLVGLIYYLTQRRGRKETAPFVATLVLLTVLMWVVTQVIGSELARAFGLVGALSIVRFRTVVEDTRDTAFVIAGVVCGMAAGSGYTSLAVAALPVIAVVSVLLRLWGREAGGERDHATLTARVAIGLDPGVVLGPVLAKYLAASRVLSAGTARQGAAIDVTYGAQLKPGSSAVALVAELNRTEGVQAAEWKEQGG